MHSRGQVQQAHEQVARPIAETVRRLRAERSWTLDQLAARSGISRRLIVQIEQAEANPSIGTWLRLAEACEVTLSDILQEQPATTAGVCPAGDELQLWSGPRGGAGRLLVSRGPLELWSWTLNPGELHESKGHQPGSVELLTLTTGTLHRDVGRETFTRNARDSAWFEATEAHAYRNPTGSRTHFILVFLGP